MQGSKDTDESQPFIHQRRKLQEVSEQLAELQSKYFAATTALEELKKAPADASDERQKYVSQLELDKSDLQGLLRHALLGRSVLDKDPADIRQTEEYKLLCQQLKLVQDAHLDEKEKTLQVTAQKIAEKIAAARREDGDYEQVSEPEQPEPQLRAASPPFDFLRPGAMPRRSYFSYRHDSGVSLAVSPTGLTPSPIPSPATAEQSSLPQNLSRTPILRQLNLAAAFKVGKTSTD